MPLMEDEASKLTGKELAKLKGKEKGKRYFCLGLKGSEAYLGLDRKRIKATELKRLKKDQGCTAVVHGSVGWGKDENVYIFRSKQAKRIEGKWETIKRMIARTAAQQFKESAFKGALLQPENAEAQGLGAETTDERALKALDEFFLYQQQMLREGDTRLDGKLDTTELSFSDAEGEPVPVDDKFLQKVGLSRYFTLTKEGGLQLKPEVMKDGVITPERRRKISEAMLAAAKAGFGVHLRNTGGDQGEMDLVSDNGRLEQSYARRAPASATNLQYDRGNEMIPGANPPVTFREAASLMSSDKVSDAEFNLLNAQIKDAFELEKDQGFIDEKMTFLQYKMQFVQISVPAVDEKGVQWRDGDGALNAAEWTFLQQKVKDLPEEPQYYHWVTYMPKGGKPEDKQGMMVPFPSQMLSKKDFDEYVKKRYNTDKFEFSIEEGSSFVYNLPGKRDILPKVKEIPAGSMRALLADESGQVKDPRSGRAVDLKDEAARKAAAESTSTVVANTVMTAAMTQWTQNAGESVGNLLKPIPDTQKVFLRQSNGSANYDNVAGVTVGQRQVTSGGNNDNGAFGKCAPTSYFCGAICGIAVAASDGLKLLKAEPLTRASGAKIEKLLSAVPTNEESQRALGAEIAAARKALQDDWAAFQRQSPRPEKAKLDARLAQLRKLWGALDSAEQVKTSIVDRMVVKSDEEGPYMEMEFLIPDARTDPYMRGQYMQSGPTRVKVRPADIQEYLEQTNRGDAYRGGKKHMMDFFKDPASMNQIQLMKSLGPGLIAVGVDKALKQAGKDSGLLYGPGAGMVSTMVYNKQTRSDYMGVGEEITAKKGTPEYEKEFKQRRGQLVGMLKGARDKGGGISVSMGYSPANGHVNYVQTWGTPQVDGVEISAEDLARCHMNYSENSATTSAWQNDRNSSTLINPTKMIQGLKGVQDKLAAAGKKERSAQLQALVDKANAAQATLNGLAKKLGYKDAADFMGRAGKWQREYDLLHQIKEDPAYDKYMDAVRAVSAETMAFFKSSMTLNHDDGGLNEENVVLMPSNTERDDSTTDDPGDRARVGGGNISDQKHGSANAADGSYFVPLNAMAGGWNGKEDKASGYAHYADDASDQFIMLKSMEIMTR